MLNVTFWVIFKHCVQRSCCPGQANIWSVLSSIAREDMYHQKTSQTKITRNCDHWTHCKKITNYVQNFNFQTKNDKLLNQNFCWKSHDFLWIFKWQNNQKNFEFLRQNRNLVKKHNFQKLLNFDIFWREISNSNGNQWFIITNILSQNSTLQFCHFFWKLNFWT